VEPGDGFESSLGYSGGGAPGRRSIGRRRAGSAQIQMGQRRQHTKRYQPEVAHAAPPNGKLFEIDECRQVVEANIGYLRMGNVQGLETRHVAHDLEGT